jgi:nucleoside-diphosphate-sugar epimerase
MAHYLITGATGLVGSHVADECVRRGHTVHALTRPHANVAHLQQIGATLHPGDLTDPVSVRAAVAQADYVVHCAAKVGDWGPVDEYRKVNVESLRHLLDACLDRPLQRFVHLSSLGVYQARHHHGTDETEPLPARHIDGYTQSKVEAEQLVLDYQRLHQVPVVVLRPGFIYGPRDRTVLPRLADRLRRNDVWYFSGGHACLNTTFVRNLVHAIFLALEHPGAVGHVYNVTDGEFISRRKFYETVADGLNLPRPTKRLPLWLARLLAYWMEWRDRRRGTPNPPRLTQAVIKFNGFNLDFSIAKARTELGYAPVQSFAPAMAETLEWYRTQMGSG